MKNNLISLLNIGEETKKKLLILNIKSKEDFLSQDPYDVFYNLLKKVNPTLPPPMLSSLVGARDGIPWYEINKACKDEFERLHPDHRWQKYRK